MNIYERLRADHDRQRELADEISETSGDSPERRRLWAEFKVEAEAHANAEEQTFYATLIEQPDTQVTARHSVSEHEEASGRPRAFRTSEASRRFPYRARTAPR